MAKQKPKRPKRSLIADLLAQMPSPTSTGRREAVQPIKKYFLLICEGARTEPNYFKALQAKLPEHLVELEISGEGYNTVSLVKTAIHKKAERAASKLLPNFDEVFAIFDKDDYSDEQFNEAVFLAKNEGIHASFSNEAFELWYVLHFQNLVTGISRKSYADILKKHLGSYAKNQPDMYDLLQSKGDEEQAIKWATMLVTADSLRNPAKAIPCTRVHELVAELNTFKQQ